MQPLEPVLDRMARDRTVRRTLSGGGMLYVDRKLPLLCVHRFPVDGEDVWAAQLVTGHAAWAWLPPEGMEMALSEVVEDIQARLAPIEAAPMFTRSLFARSLRREVNQARASGVDVLVIRPSVSELRELGSNAMRSFDRQRLTSVAREGTLRLLHQKSEHPVLASSQR